MRRTRGKESCRRMITHSAVYVLLSIWRKLAAGRIVRMVLGPGSDESHRRSTQLVINWIENSVVLTVYFVAFVTSVLHFLPSTDSISRLALQRRGEKGREQEFSRAGRFRAVANTLFSTNQCSHCHVLLSRPLGDSQAQVLNPMLQKSNR